MAAKERVVILMDKAEIERMDAIAAAQRVSRGEVGRQAMRWWADWIQAKGSPPAPVALPDPLQTMPFGADVDNA